MLAGDLVKRHHEARSAAVQFAKEKPLVGQVTVPMMSIYLEFCFKQREIVALSG